LGSAREWVDSFVFWYNNEHKHSKINIVRLSQRHLLKDREVLANRKVVLEAAKANNPLGLSKEVRSCEPVGTVTLNPDKPAKKEQRRLYRG